MFLTLSGKAREAVLEMDTDDLSSDDGMTKLYEKLDSLFKVDKDQAALIPSVLNRWVGICARQGTPRVLCRNSSAGEPEPSVLWS